MRLIVIWAVVFFIAAALATLMLYDNGRVSMVWGEWVLETSLSFLLAVVLAIITLGYLAVQVVMVLWNLPQTLAKRRQVKRYSSAQNTLHQGLLALEYGDWQKAEKLLLKSAKQSESGLVHYLSAAKMAHNQNETDRRDFYLKQAREQYPEEYVIIGLVEARLLSAQQSQESIGVLKALFEDNPKNPAVVRELAQGYRDGKHWQALDELLPVVKKTKAIVREDLWKLERQLMAGKLTLCTEYDTLQTYWSGLPKKHQLDPEVLSEYVEQCLSFQQEQGLKEWIEKSVGKLWSDRLVYQYGRLSTGPAFERLKAAEKWLDGRKENPVLLLTLGRLACQSQMWVMAQNYLKQSLKLYPQLETFHALATCYESEGKTSEASLIYKEAIERLEDKQVNPLLEK